MTPAVPGWIEADWPAPARVRVVSTLRGGGVSVAPFESLNLALHVGDEPGAVRTNRRRLAEALPLPSEPLWLEQVHGTTVVRHPAAAPGVQADASVAFEPGPVCAVLTADCLPVVLTDRSGSCIGIAHAGWRGLLGGVLGNTIDALQASSTELLAWLGPAIGAPAFEVGDEVRAAFVARDPGAAACFTPNARQRFQADLYGLARRALARAGVTAVHGGGWCTYREARRFFSYRRDGRTGRMATLAWLA